MRSIVPSIIAAIVAGVAAADTVTITPIDAQAVTDDGLAWTLDTASFSLNCSRFTGIPLQRRGVIEFPLAAISTGSTVTSATLHYNVDTFTGGSGTPAFIECHGYPGNGTIAQADATALFNAIGLSAAVTSLGPASMNLSAGYVRSLVGVSSHLGVMTYQPTQSRQASMSATETGSNGPRLVIEFTPPAAANQTVVAPLDAHAVSMAGGEWMLDSASFSLVAAQSFDQSREDRGVMEFALSGIPSHATILRAQFEFSVQLLNMPPSPTIEFHGYVANGALTAADAAVPDNVVGTTAPLSSLGRMSAGLSAPYIQAVRGRSMFVGVLARQPRLGSQAGFWATEMPVAANRPRLIIDWQPGACPADFDRSGTPTLQDLFDYLGAWFADSPAADFDGLSGVTLQDLFDYLGAFFEGCG